MNGLILEPYFSEKGISVESESEDIKKTCMRYKISVTLQGITTESKLAMNQSILSRGCGTEGLSCSLYMSVENDKVEF